MDNDLYEKLAESLNTKKISLNIDENAQKA